MTLDTCAPPPPHPIPNAPAYARWRHRRRCERRESGDGAEQQRAPALRACVRADGPGSPGAVTQAARRGGSIDTRARAANLDRGKLARLCGTPPLSRLLWVPQASAAIVQRACLSDGARQGCRRVESSVWVRLLPRRWRRATRHAHRVYVGTVRVGTERGGRGPGEVAPKESGTKIPDRRRQCLTPAVSVGSQQDLVGRHSFWKEGGMPHAPCRLLML